MTEPIHLHEFFPDIHKDKNINKNIADLKRFNTIAAYIQGFNAITQFIIGNKTISNALLKTTIPARWKFPIQREKYYQKFKDTICYSMDVMSVDVDNGVKKLNQSISATYNYYDDKNDEDIHQFEGQTNLRYNKFVAMAVNSVIRNGNACIIIELNLDKYKDNIDKIKSELERAVRKNSTGLGNFFDVIILRSSTYDDNNKIGRVFEFNGLMFSDEFYAKSYDNQKNEESIDSFEISENVEMDIKEFVEKIIEKYDIVKGKMDITRREEMISSTQTYNKCIGKGISLSYTMSLFSALTCLAHVFLVRNHDSLYKNWIKNDQIQYARWIEYSITSSIMVTALAGIVGITSIEELIPIFILSSATNIFGLGIESIKSNKPKLKNVKKILFGMATITHSYPWIRIITKFFAALNNFDEMKDLISNCSVKGRTDEIAQKRKDIRDLLLERLELVSGLSGLIKSAIVGLAIIYFSFPINMINQYFNKNKENGNFIDKKHYIQGEKNYIILSMIAKSFLSWVLFAASFRNPREDLDICK